MNTASTGKVAVLMGGTSAERDISLQSGAAVLAAFEGAGIDAFGVDTQEVNWQRRLQGCQIAFIALHGPGGEDGSIQGALQLLDIPYTGTGVLGSALALDKRSSKQLWRGVGIPTADFETLHDGTDWDAVIAKLGAVFVKPLYEGSSLGMARTDSGDALASAYANARQYGPHVIAEQFIDGPEYTVAILGEEALPSIRLETENTFYDYQAKYESDSTHYHLPSGLTAAEESEIAALSLRAFAALSCCVWGRVDLMRDAAGKFWVLEVNTVPGMTSHSLVPMAAAATGLDMPALVQRIVDLSLQEVR